MGENSEILIGNKGAEHVSIKISRRGYEGWSSAEIEVQCDGWFGQFRGEFMKGELSNFANQVSRLHRDLSGTAELQPIEPNVKLTLTGDGKGHIVVVGTARNHFESDTLLKFRFVIDQTYLKDLLDALTAADPA